MLEKRPRYEALKKGRKLTRGTVGGKSNLPGKCCRYPRVSEVSTGEAIRRGCRLALDGPRELAAAVRRRGFHGGGSRTLLQTADRRRLS